ncbi:NAD(P)H-dependent oxidoreductase [Pseudomonas indica]|uniref:NAD(P)H-dependent oxidoreductase n=1 Tax=Pseudomonas indica TaxID=137658 RepID=UPI003FD64B40
MKCLLVTAHPLPDSLCATLATHVRETLEARGHEVVIEDLYQREFAPALSVRERASYYQPTYHLDAVAGEIDRLLQAEAIVLVFPTWWFGFPAILKGWFDRVWAPGIAYDHANDFGPIRPRLHRLRHVLAVTTLGSPAWVDWLVLRRPVRRVLKIALLQTCAPQARFGMLSLYRSERLDEARIDRFRQRIACTLTAWPSSLTTSLRQHNPDK